jgi:hypothetical protein
MSDEIKNKLKSMFSPQQLVENKEVITNVTVKTQEGKEIDDTHQYVDRALKQLIDTAGDVVAEAAAVAKATGEPEHFKAFAQVMRETGKITTDILEILKIKKFLSEKIEPPSQDQIPPQTSTTNVYINGTMNDVLKSIKDEQKKVIDVKPIQEE